MVVFIGDVPLFRDRPIRQLFKIRLQDNIDDIIPCFDQLIAKIITQKNGRFSNAKSNGDFLNRHSDPLKTVHIFPQ